MIRTLSLVSSILLALAACESVSDVCLLPGVSGITLRVVDSDTGADLNPVTTLTVTQLSAPFAVASGNLVTGDPRPLSLADDRPGSYRVRVEVVAYLPWEQIITVQLSSGRCARVVTQHRTVQLEREESR